MKAEKNSNQTNRHTHTMLIKARRQVPPDAKLPEGGGGSRWTKNAQK